MLIVLVKVSPRAIVSRSERPTIPPETSQIPVRGLNRPIVARFALTESTLRELLC
jgi:hypothetical protein